MIGVAWMIAVGVASAIMFTLLALSLVDADSTNATRATIAAIAVGFFAGGLVAGLRVRAAPILHGLFIGLMSVPVWFVINVIASLAFPSFGWQALTPNLAAAIVLIQIASAIVGARSGYRKTSSAKTNRPPQTSS